MVHGEDHSSDSKPDRAPSGDLGRRVTMRREQLGLSRQAVAERAGSAPSYLQYVEERQATPGIGFLLRLAQALETTVDELTGGTTELPRVSAAPAITPSCSNSAPRSAAGCCPPTAWAGSV